jgi:hypothetical protein
VTRGIGLMAGLEIRQKVANLGRSGQPEALSLAGSIHPYSDQQQTVKVGRANEGIVGTLRRTNESQLEVSSPGPTSTEAGFNKRAGFDASSFWSAAFSERSQWPLPYAEGSDIGNASEYIVQQIWPDDATCDDPSSDPCVKDVRQEYISRLGDIGDDSWESNYRDLNAIDPTEDLPDDWSDSQKDAFTKLQRELLKEFNSIARVKGMIGAYQQIFTSEEDNDLLDMSYISTKVKSEVMKEAENYETEQAQLNAEAPVGESLYFVADIFDAFEGGEALGGPVAMFASAWDFFSHIAESSDKESNPVPHPPNLPQLIEDQADQVGHDLFESYETMNLTLYHIAQLLTADSAKLKAAAGHANGSWQLTTSGTNSNRKLLIQALSTGIERSLYQALLPVAYDQWWISPVFQADGSNQGPANVNDVASLIGYDCKAGPNPFTPENGGSSAPGSTVSYVRWEPSLQNSDNATGKGAYQRRNHSIGVGLKSKANPLLTEVNDDSHEQPVRIPQSAGTGTGGGDSPPDDLMTPLFAPVSLASQPYDPQGLAMTREDVFGLESFDRGRLQCSASRDGASTAQPKSKPADPSSAGTSTQGTSTEGTSTDKGTSTDEDASSDQSTSTAP